MSWQALETQQPELAAFGKERLNGRVAYLATVRQNGAPRLHPVTPIIGHGRLFVFMEPTSPKGRDLQRDGRYALHCAVDDSSGASGEFLVTGRGHLVEDANLRAQAEAVVSYTPAARYILFTLDIERAAATTYAEDGPVRQSWQQDK